GANPSPPKNSPGPRPPQKGGVQNTKQPHTSSARRSEPLHRKAAARLALRLILTKRVICGGPKFNWILGDSGSRVFRGKAVRRTAYENSEQLSYKIREAAELFRSTERPN